MYQGQYEKNKMHGKGTLEWSNGVKFEGRFKEGKRLDEGVKMLLKGDSLVGTFRGEDLQASDRWLGFPG